MSFKWQYCLPIKSYSAFSLFIFKFSLAIISYSRRRQNNSAVIKIFSKLETNKYQYCSKYFCQFNVCIENLKFFFSFRTYYNDVHRRREECVYQERIDKVCEGVCGAKNCISKFLFLFFYSRCVYSAICYTSTIT